MCRPSVAAASPLWLAAVGSDSKDNVQHAADEKGQTAAVDQADVAAALREASPALRWRARTTALRPREIEAKISKHVRSYLPPARLVIYRQVNHEWLRAIEDELRE